MTLRERIHCEYHITLSKNISVTECTVVLHSTCTISLFSGSGHLWLLLLYFCQEICVFLEWRLGQLQLWPQIGSQVCVGIGDGCKCCLGW